MTLVESKFICGSLLKENTWRAIDDIRDVYGIHGLWFDNDSHTIRVEYDASRLREGDVAALLRDAGVDFQIWDT